MPKEIKINFIYFQIKMTEVDEFVKDIPEITIFESDDEFVNDNESPLKISSVYSLSRNVQSSAVRKKHLSSIHPSFRRKVLRRSKNLDKMHKIKKQIKKIQLNIMKIYDIIY